MPRFNSALMLVGVALGMAACGGETVQSPAPSQDVAGDAATFDATEAAGAEVRSDLPPIGPGADLGPTPDVPDIAGDDAITDADLIDMEAETDSADTGDPGVIDDTLPDVTPADAEDIAEVSADVPVLPTPTCGTYCTTVLSACTGTLDGFDALPADDAATACGAYCSSWGALAAGVPGDNVGHSLACHASWASTAVAAPSASTCAAAGPYGGNTCGTGCEVYCTWMAAHCAGTYADAAACAAACAGFSPSGAYGATSGDTLECRLTHALLAGAVADVAGACASAAAASPACAPAPTGDSCADAIPLGLPPTTVVGDTTTLLDDLAAVPECAAKVLGSTAGGKDLPDQVFAFTPLAAGTYRFTLTPTGFTGPAYVAVLVSCDQTVPCLGASGDVALGGSVTVTLEANQAVRVVVDGLLPGDVGPFELSVDLLAAEPACITYCGLMTQACTGPAAQYGSEAACLAYCLDAAPWDPPTQTLAANTVACRVDRAIAAGTDAGQCGAAGPSGGNVCGSWCDVYCDLAAIACPPALAPYADAEECALACQTFAMTGLPGTLAGDTVQCRLAHLGAALTGSALEVAAHCLAGGVSGGGVCVPAPLEGDSCGQPIVVTALPFEHEGNTALLADHLHGGPKCTVVTDFDTGDGTDGPDAVYAFTPPATGTYVASLTFAGGLGNPSMLYVTTDCAGLPDSCAAVSADLYLGGDFTFQATAGVPLTLVVDGWYPGDAGPYMLTLKAAE